MTEPGRRNLLGMMAAFGALTVLVVTVSLIAGAVKRRATGDAPSEEVAAFLGPLAGGARFGGGHRIARIEPLCDGRLTIEIEDERGERHLLDVRAFSSTAPAPVAATARLAIYLRSDRGGAPTPASAARASTALAAVLRAREESGHPPPTLTPLASPSP